MMGMRMPETCWAVFKLQVINLRSCCIWLDDSVESVMMHGLANPKFIYGIQRIIAFTAPIVTKLRNAKRYFRDLLCQISRKSSTICEHCRYRFINAFNKIWLPHNISLLDKLCQELLYRISSKSDKNYQILTLGQEYAEARLLHIRRSMSLRKKCLESKISIWNA